MEYFSPNTFYTRSIEEPKVVVHGILDELITGYEFEYYFRL